MKVLSYTKIPPIPTDPVVRVELEFDGDEVKLIRHLQSSCLKFYGGCDLTANQGELISSEGRKFMLMIEKMRNAIIGFAAAETKGDK